jgi:hypothetical protein
MSVLASRLDPAPATHRANRSAKLRLLEERDEQFAQSRAGSERSVPAIGTRYRAASLPLRAGEGYGRLRRVPDVRIKAVVTNRGKLTRQGRATGTFMGRAKRLNSSAAHGDGLDCEQLAFGLFPNGDGRPSSKASYLIADDVWPSSCDQKWIGPGGLEVPTPVKAEDRSTLDPAARWALGDRCLTDERIDPATRLAGCLVLLFGQFATRLVALPLTAIASDEQQVAICLGATPLPLPAPLDTLAVAAREHARAQQRTSPMWLFPGLIPGEHLSADQLRTRLRQLGIHRQLTARNTVWAALAAEVPPVVLAEKLGVSVSMADRWRVALGIDRARYVALIQDDQSDPPTGWSVSSQDP